MQSSLVVDLTSIGTLFAFILVSGGVLLLPRISGRTRGGFRLPYINGQYIVPAAYLLFVYISYERIIENLAHLSADSLQEILFILFILLGAVMAVLTFVRKFSLIPVMGVLFCSYLLIEIPEKSWLWFLVWMGLGLAIYFLYGYRNSALKVKS